MSKAPDTIAPKAIGGSRGGGGGGAPTGPVTFTGRVALPADATACDLLLAELMQGRADAEAKAGERAKAEAKRLGEQMDEIDTRRRAHFTAAKQFATVAHRLRNGAAG